MNLLEILVLQWLTAQLTGECWHATRVNQPTTRHTFRWLKLIICIFIVAKTDTPTNGAKIRLRVAQDDDVLLPQTSRKEGTLKITTNGRVSTVRSHPEEMSQSPSGR